MPDSETGWDTKIGTATAALSAFVLTVSSDFNGNTIKVTSPTHIDTCARSATCNFAYLQGTSLTIHTDHLNRIFCSVFDSWVGACAGQTETCTIVINSDLSTTSVFADLGGGSGLCEP